MAILRLRRLIHNQQLHKLKFKEDLPDYKNKLRGKVSILMQQYEDFIGLTELKSAQNSVLEAESSFVATQSLRRKKQIQLLEISTKLKEIRSEIDKASRGEDRFLRLLTEEHAIIKQENSLIEEFKLCEIEEREHFTSLSVALRKSHEKERSQTEKTKYWSVIASLIGAFIGITGTTINNRYRMNTITNAVNNSVESNRSSIKEAFTSVSAQFNQVNENLKRNNEHLALLVRNSKQPKEEPKPTFGTSVYGTIKQIVLFSFKPIGYVLSYLHPR